MSPQLINTAECYIILSMRLTYSDYQISIEEYTDFIKSEKLSEKLNTIWEDILRRIEIKKLQKEAEKMGFFFESDPDKDDDIVADYKIIVPTGSEKLRKYFEDNIYSSVVCLKI